MVPPSESDTTHRRSALARWLAASGSAGEHRHLSLRLRMRLRAVGGESQRRLRPAQHILPHAVETQRSRRRARAECGGGERVAGRRRRAALLPAGGSSRLLLQRHANAEGSCGLVEVGGRGILQSRGMNTQVS